MKVVRLTILFLAVARVSAAQQPVALTADSAFTLVQTFPAAAIDAVIDNLNNLYLVSPTGQVKKLNASGDSSGIYSQTKNYGKLHSIDVSNPLRPLLFYKAFSTVVLLDRFLVPRTTLDLRRHQILQPGAVATSYDNNLWVFDEYDNKLKKIDERGNLLLETPDFRNIFEVPVKPQKIINDNGLVYLADSLNGIFVFDNYGTFKKSLRFKNWKNVFIKDNYVVQTYSTHISLFNTTNFLETQKRLPAGFYPYVAAFSTTGNLVTYSTDSVRIYHYTF